MNLTIPDKNQIQKFLKNKKYSSLAGAGAILLIIVLFLFFKSSPVNNSIPVYKVKKDKMLVTIIESGEISAKNAVSITTPRVRGSLKIVLLAPEGSMVKEGAVVVQFDPTEALNQLREAESRLEVSLSEKAKLVANHKSTMTRAENDVQNAELTFELSKLNQEQMKFEAEIKQREAKLQHRRNELNLVRAKQDLESQKIIQKSEMNKTDIDIQQRRADLDKAKKDLEQLSLSAPKDGLVVYEQNWSTGRKITIGDTPWPGMTLVSLPNLTAMQSITYVNEVDVSRVHKGLKVAVTLDAFRDSVFQGTIENIAPLGKSKDGNSSIKVFEILVGIHSQSDLLKPGMTTSNKIIINEIAQVIAVPHEALFEKGKKQIVYVKNRSGFEEREVVFGVKGEDLIVIEKGLFTGEEVALVDPTIKPAEDDAAATEGSTNPPPKSNAKGKK
ncbi:MAG: efflux RND transporter periplasmic adaptor subunit [Ignavibacteriales bacterium]|nr:efflux RND transporter periplasmic adaptor subunit [Ignavibacteriales bacterium]